MKDYVASVPIQHNNIVIYLLILFQLYMEYAGGGEVFKYPFTMRAAEDLPACQPDIQVILPERADIIKANQVAGPAHLVVEVVSPESVGRDRGEKFREYEHGGVNEYWIIDPVREEALFYVRGDDGLYRARAALDGVYTSSVLPKLQLTVSTLWGEQMPTVTEIVKHVEALLA